MKAKKTTMNCATDYYDSLYPSHFLYFLPSRPSFQPNGAQKKELLANEVTKIMPITSSMKMRTKDTFSFYSFIFMSPQLIIQRKKESNKKLTTL